MKLSFKAARTNADLTQKEVAAMIGVTERTIWNLENGKTKPNMDTLIALANVYGCEVTDFKEMSKN